MSNKKTTFVYVGIAIMVLIFGVWVATEWHRRATKNNDLLTFEKVSDFRFINQDNVVIDQNHFKGKVYVLAFFFTSCPNICPKMIHHKLLLQQKFYARPDFGMVSITIDPDRDTPKKLRAYRKKNGITLQNWQMLTGDEEQIYDFANNGFKLYARKGNFEHSGLFALVDKKGHIRSRTVTVGENTVPLKYYDGLDPKVISMLKEDIQILLKEK